MNTIQNTPPFNQITINFDEASTADKVSSIVKSHDFKPKEVSLNGPMTVEHLTPDYFPPVMTTLFLSYLDPDYLEKVSQVEGWEKFANDKVLWNAFDLKQLFPKLTIIDEMFWKDKVKLLKVDVKDTKPIDHLEKREMIRVITKLLPQVEGNEGITILTIPKELTFNNLVNFAEALAGQHGNIFRHIWQKFRDKYENVAVDATYRVMLTNNVLSGTRNLSVQAQKDLVDKLGIGCEFPKVIEMVTLLIATLLNSNTRLFNPWTFSRCDENIDNWQLIVGDSAAYSGFSVTYDGFDAEFHGLAGRRKF